MKFHENLVRVTFIYVGGQTWCR